MPVCVPRSKPPLGRAGGIKSSSPSPAVDQSAVNALPRSGGAVFFPLGTYLISSNIKTGARPVIFRGQGRASILKARGTSLTAILEMNHASAAGSRVSLLTFHGSKTGGTGEIQRGVYAHGAANCVVSECTFSGPTADVVTGLNFGVDLYRAHGSRVVDCRFERMVSSGGNGTSVLIEMTDNCEVRGCSIDGSKFSLSTVLFRAHRELFFGKHRYFKSIR